MHKGLIIIDGPDGAGKTTLAHAFLGQPNVKYIHLTYRWKEQMFRYHTVALIRAMKFIEQGHLVVIDRQWMSEICYAEAYRGGTKWPLMWRFMQRVINKVGGIYVYALPVDTRTHLESFACLKDQRQELFKDILPVTIEYHKLWDKVKGWPNVLRYDRSTDGKSFNDFTSLVYTKLRMRRDAQDPYVLDPANWNVTGHVGDANYLIVGDVTNPRKRKGTFWPFHDYQHSSLHLAQTMDDLGINENEFLYTNIQGQPEMARYLLQKYELMPICLGKNAYDHLTNGAGNYYRHNRPMYIAHPSYDRRFNNGRSTMRYNLSAAYNLFKLDPTLRGIGTVFDRGSLEYEEKGNVERNS